MAALGSLQHIFEHPLPETPNLVRTLSSSWKQLKPVRVKPIEQSSVTEIFGELRLEQVFMHTVDENENVETTSTTTTTKKAIHKKSCSLNYESLQVCTERIGSESSASVDETKHDLERECQCGKEKIAEAEASAVMSKKRKYLHGDCRANRSRRSNSLGEFPPPITCIGKYGTPWVCFKSYRQDGRHVLKQVIIPTKEMLHACRQDGRLKLRFMQLKNKSTERRQGSDEEEDESMEHEHGSEEEGLLNNDEIDEGEEQRQATYKS